MKTTRPVFLNLWQIKFPVTAIVSILHRISGVVIFLGLPFLLYILSQSLISQDSFDHLAAVLVKPGIKLLVWILVAAVTGHFFAGIRHLFMDMGIAEGLKGGRMSAYIVLVISILIIIFLGIWIWS